MNNNDPHQNESRSEDNQEMDWKNQILDEVSEAIFLHDLQGRIIYANQVTYGGRYYQEASESFTIRDIAIVDYSKLIKSHWGELKKGKVVFESTYQQPQGNLIPVEIQARTIKLDGEPLILTLFKNIKYPKEGQSEIGLVSDVSDLEKVEMGVDNNISQKLINSMKDGLLVLDRKGRPIMINPAFTYMTHYTLEEITGAEPSHPYWSPEDTSQVLEIIRGEMEDLELFFHRKDGTRFPVIISPSSFIAPDGEKYYFVTIKDISSLKNVENELKNALKEKDVLMSEVHHRVKNNLQIISSLLSLQSDYIQNKKDLEIFRDTQNRAKSMALIHEKLYQSNSMKNLNIRDYILALCDEIMNTYRGEGKEVDLKLDIDDMMLDVDVAMPVGLILNELISNSLKHAFPDNKGKIELKLKEVSSRVLIEVIDDGVGISDDLDWRNTNSLGLQLVNNLTRQIDGSIEMDNSQGTHFSISFPQNQ